MKKFTPLQVALIGSIVMNDEANLPEFIEAAKRVEQLHELGDPYDVALALSFLGEVFKPTGALADDKNLQKLVEKLVYWLNV